MPIPREALPTNLDHDIEDSCRKDLHDRFHEALTWADGCDRRVSPRRSTTKEWTEFVLDWWASVGRLGKLAVDCRPGSDKIDWATTWNTERPDELPERGRSNEFLNDLIIASYPPYKGNFYTDGYWDGVLKGEPRQILVALESEWGAENSAAMNRGKVLEDATKLVHVRARLKVLVFGVKKDHAKSLIKDVSQLRERDEDPSTPWLLFPVPWDDSPMKIDPLGTH
jgi:hypothetical protein